jgi:hypothetical protein
MSIYILSSSFETFIVMQWLKNNKCLTGEVDSHHSVSCHTALSEKRFMGKENGNKYNHRCSAIIIKSLTIPEKFTDSTICRKLQISNIIHDLLTPHLSIVEIPTHYSYFSAYSGYRSHPQPCYKGKKHLSTTVL